MKCNVKRLSEADIRRTDGNMEQWVSHRDVCEAFGADRAVITRTLARLQQFGTSIVCPESCRRKVTSSAKDPFLVIQAWRGRIATVTKHVETSKISVVPMCLHSPSVQGYTKLSSIERTTYSLSVGSEYQNHYRVPRRIGDSSCSQYRYCLDYMELVRGDYRKCASTLLSITIMVDVQWWSSGVTSGEMGAWTSVSMTAVPSPTTDVIRDVLERSYAGRVGDGSILMDDNARSMLSL